MESVIAFKLHVHLISNHLCDPFNLVFTHSGTHIVLISPDLTAWPLTQVVLMYAEPFSMLLAPPIWLPLGLIPILQTENLSSCCRNTYPPPVLLITVYSRDLFVARFTSFITIIYHDVQYSSSIVGLFLSKLWEYFYSVTSNLHQILWRIL